jgi:hypothetical protein
MTADRGQCVLVAALVALGLATSALLVHAREGVPQGEPPLVQVPGEEADRAGVAEMETGYYDGEGDASTWVGSTLFAAGDAVVVRARVFDESEMPIADATIEILIAGPERVTLESGPSDANGWAEVTWSTEAPAENDAGTVAGTYSAVTKKVTVPGYTWDGAGTSVVFLIQLQVNESEVARPEGAPSSAPGPSSAIR